TFGEKGVAPSNVTFSPACLRKDQPAVKRLFELSGKNTNPPEGQSVRSLRQSVTSAWALLSTHCIRCRAPVSGSSRMLLLISSPVLGSFPLVIWTCHSAGLVQE